MRDVCLQTDNIDTHSVCDIRITHAHHYNRKVEDEPFMVNRSALTDLTLPKPR